MPTDEVKNIEVPVASMEAVPILIESPIELQPIELKDLTESKKEDIPSKNIGIVIIPIMLVLLYSYYIALIADTNII